LTEIPANQDKRSRILDAAEDVFSRKGLIKARIAEIARLAGVTDSVIYQFFRGKEDLLFSIPAERMPRQIDLLEESLQGIRDAESRLSKMIWFHLRRNETDREFARLLLLECRSNKHFYDSRGYVAIRAYAGKMLHILEEGVRDGIFRDDVDMRLVRDVIFGALDFEALNYLVTRETLSPSTDLEHIMALILPMIRMRSGGQNRPMDKASRILLAAEEVFAEKGFVRATIADVAKVAKVAEGTVYEYYQNKEDLLLSIPDKRFRDHLDDLEETFEIRMPISKLKRLIKNHFALYLTNRDFLRVFIIQIQLSERFYRSQAYNTFRTYLEKIEDVIEEGKSSGSFRSEINSRVFRNLFLGTFSQMALRWFVLGREPSTDKMSEIDQLTDLLSLAVLAERPEIQQGTLPS
jgi:TetR/AcrR family transcriptional regulator, fatty acid metabolism regulator protein